MIINFKKIKILKLFLNQKLKLTYSHSISNDQHIQSINKKESFVINQKQQTQKDASNNKIVSNYIQRLLNNISNNQETKIIQIQIEKNKIQSIHLFNQLLKNYLTQEDFDSFDQIFYNKKRNKFTYLTIIDFFIKKRNYERAYEYYSILKKYYGPDPRSAAYILQFQKQNKNTEILLQDIIKNIEDSDKQTFKCTLRYYINNNLLNNVTKLVSIIIEKKHFDVQIYNSFLEFIEKNDHFHLFDQNLMNIKEFDNFTYRIIIKIQIRLNDSFKVEHFFSQMIEYNFVPSIIIFNEIIQYFCGILDEQKAQKYFDLMKNYQIQYDIQICNHFIELYKKQKDQKACERFYEKIIKIYNLKPNNLTLNNILYLFIDQKEKFDFYLNQFNSFKVQKDIHTYNAIILNYQKQKKHEEINKVLNKISEKSIKPNNITISLIIDSFGFTRDIQNLQRFIMSLNYQNNSFDENNFNSILEACFKCQQIDLMLQYFKIMCQEFSLLYNPNKTFNILNDSLKNHQQQQKEIRIFFQQNYPEIF